MKFSFKNNNLKTTGFTLVEIVIVIAIMGIMSTIIYSDLGASRENSRDQKRVSDISTIQLALEQYFYKYGVYPVTLTDSNFVPAFLNAIPTPASSGDSPYQNNYFPITKSQSSSNCISYQLWTKFERTNVYLQSKKSFNSTDLPAPLPTSSKTLYECGGSGTHVSAEIDASSPANALVYDVMP